MLFLSGMYRFVEALLTMLSAATVFALDADLPAPDEGPTLKIDPPLLIQNRDREESSPDGNPNAERSLDFANLERDVARAERNADSAEPLYKAGIISKIEAEERVIKLVRLQAKLAEARLQEAKGDLEQLKSERLAGSVASNDLEAAERLVNEATQTADRVTEELRRTQTAAAARDVQRQQKLLALGSGRKGDLRRAQKLADLQQPVQ
ncbi:MAG: hypothetical protein H0X73_10725 [Chthoniobacterales bacterium]|nr:hypothetical protein [Chthoniobacterales bacterium]